MLGIFDFIFRSEIDRRVRRELSAHDDTLRKVQAECRERELCAAKCTSELRLLKARFDTALRGAQVYVWSQDRDLKPTWSYSPHGTDSTPPDDSETVVAIKRAALESGVPQDAEVSYAMRQGPVLFALHVEPTFDTEHKIDGITCAAIDVSRIRLLEGEQHRLAEELGSALQRYDIALRGSNVTVFTQDRDLRYTSISNALFGRRVEDIIGRTDEEILPVDGRGAVEAMKREVLATGAPHDGEVTIADGQTVRSFDLHIEPLRDAAGAIAGLTCAAVDITERKEGEAHLRLLMRELTHRSKNLLAVIQAMSRQSARTATTVDRFVQRFDARLQGLARSHDLLVQEEWHGASLLDVVRSQLGPYLAPNGERVKIGGPQVLLRPEAAQSLGLALHELTSNAESHGALSAPGGRVSVTWAWRPDGEHPAVDLVWQEKGGPEVISRVPQGFGRLIIERNLMSALDANVELTFAAEGARCFVSIPATQLQRPG